MKKSVVFIVMFIFVIASLSFVFAENNKPEKITFIHYKDGKIKPVTNPAKPSVNTCYKLLGAKWTNTPINYVINPTNKDGLSESFVASAIFASAEEWDKYTSKELFNDAYTIDYSANWDDVAPDYRNEVSFGNYPQTNVIAVTNIWVSGRGKNKIIVDYDVMFDNDFVWGDASINPALMDLQNIAVHEIGHGLGLADLYNTCVQETMYGYSTEGEISKRDLNSGDIAGIRKLYGN